MSDKQYTLIAKTMAGLEPILEKELSELGAAKTQQVNRAVTFEGGNEIMYKANFWCRSCLRILRMYKEFQARNEKELYEQIRAIQWYKLIPVDGTLAVDTFLHNSEMTHTRYVSQKVKDAIVDQFRDNFNQRPSVELESPDLRINLHISGEHCTLSFDSSGVSLHKRGYKQETGKAPINEVLAAGMLMLSGWNGNSNLLDPMCGSGTILMEAALMASHIPPAFYRKDFGFMKWMDFEPRLWKKIKDEAFRYQQDPDIEIVGYDLNSHVLKKAENNLRFAKLHYDIRLEKQEFSQSKPPFETGTIVMNPPYGERLKKINMDEFYAMIGDTLKQNYPGFDAWIISSDLKAIKNIGLKTSQKQVLYNGPLECRYNKYEMYEGSKRESDS